MSYRNHEGYSDPTAGIALRRIQREERRRKYRQKQEEEETYDKISGVGERDYYPGGEGLQSDAPITQTAPKQLRRKDERKGA